MSVPPFTPASSSSGQSSSMKYFESSPVSQSTTAESSVSMQMSVDTAGAEHELEDASSHLEQGLAGLMNIQNEIKNLKSQITIKTKEIASIQSQYAGVQMQYDEANKNLRDERDKSSHYLHDLQTEKSDNAKLKSRLKEALAEAKRAGGDREELQSLIKDLEAQIKALHDAEDKNRDKLAAFNQDLEAQLKALQAKHEKELMDLQAKCEEWAQQIKDSAAREANKSKDLQRKIDELRSKQCGDLNNALDKARQESQGDLKIFMKKIDQYASDVAQTTDGSGLSSLLNELQGEIQGLNQAREELITLRSSVQKDTADQVSKIEGVKKEAGNLQNEIDMITRERDNIRAASEKLSQDLQNKIGELDQLSKELATASNAGGQASSELMKTKKALQINTTLVDGSMKNIDIAAEQLSNFVSKIKVVARLTAEKDQALKERDSSRAEQGSLQKRVETTTRDLTKIEGDLQKLAGLKNQDWMKATEQLTTSLRSYQTKYDGQTPKLYNADLGRPINMITQAYLEKVMPAGGLQADLDLIQKAAILKERQSINSQIQHLRENDATNYKQTTDKLLREHKSAIDVLRKDYDQLIKSETSRQTQALMKIQAKADRELNGMSEKMAKLEEMQRTEKRRLENDLERAGQANLATEAQVSKLKAEIDALSKRPSTSFAMPDFAPHTSEADQVTREAKSTLEKMSTKHARELDTLQQSHAKSLASLRGEYDSATQKVVETLNGKFAVQFNLIRQKETDLNKNLDDLSTLIKKLSNQQFKTFTDAATNMGSKNELMKTLRDVESKLAKARAENDAHLMKAQREKLPDLNDLESSIRGLIKDIHQGGKVLSDGHRSLDGLVNQSNAEVWRQKEALEKGAVDAATLRRERDHFKGQLQPIQASLEEANSDIRRLKQEQVDSHSLQREVDQLRTLINKSPEIPKVAVHGIEDKLSKIQRCLVDLDRSKAGLVSNFESISEHLTTIAFDSHGEKFQTTVIADFMKDEISAKDAEIDRLRDLVTSTKGADGTDTSNEAYILRCQLNVAEAELERKQALIESRIKAHDHAHGNLKSKHDDFHSKYTDAKSQISVLKDEKSRLEALLESRDHVDVDEKLDNLRDLYHTSVSHVSSRNEANLDGLKKEYESSMRKLETENSEVKTQLNVLKTTLDAQKAKIRDALKALEKVDGLNEDAKNAYRELEHCTREESSSLLDALYQLAIKIIGVDHRSSTTTTTFESSSTLGSTGGFHRRRQPTRDLTPSNPILKTDAPNPLKRGATNVFDSGTDGGKRRKIGTNAFQSWTKSANDSDSDSGGNRFSNLKSKLFN